MTTWELIQSGGPLGMMFVGFVLFVRALTTRQLVLGWTHEALEKRCAKLEEEAYATQLLADRLVVLLERYERRQSPRSHINEDEPPPSNHHHGHERRALGPR